MLNGLLLIDKPRGWTSFDVVAKIRGVVRAEAKKQGVIGKIKVGHTGTLDPMATGLLVIAIGSYTKKVPELTKQDKTYRATMTLGKTSNTDDAEGDLAFVSSAQPSESDIGLVLQNFVGTIQQVPPQFSAIKIAGVRSYNAARAGKEVRLEPRSVTIYSISDINYEYPTVTFLTHVGSGTYIRSIARDVGARLGVGAYLSDLRRTQVGNFSINAACSVDGMTYATIEKNLLASA